MKAFEIGFAGQIGNLKRRQNQLSAKIVVEYLDLNICFVLELFSLHNLVVGEPQSLKNCYLLFKPLLVVDRFLLHLRLVNDLDIVNLSLLVFALLVAELQLFVFRVGFLADGRVGLAQWSENRCLWFTHQRVLGGLNDFRLGCPAYHSTHGLLLRERGWFLSLSRVLAG